MSSKVNTAGADNRTSSPVFKKKLQTYPVTKFYNSSGLGIIVLYYLAAYLFLGWSAAAIAFIAGYYYY